MKPKDNLIQGRIYSNVTFDNKNYGTVAISTKQSEKDVEAYLRKEMRKIGGEASKWLCPHHRGKPDRICEFPYGLVIFAEVKSEGEKPKPRQLREFKRMRERHQTVEILDTKQKVDAFIEKYRERDIAIFT